MKKICIAQMVCFYILTASLSIPCYGEEVKVKFSGNVSYVAGLQSVFTIGRPFDVTISYDTETPLTTLSSTRGLYENAITLLTFDYDNASYVGDASGLNIYILATMVLMEKVIDFRLLLKMLIWFHFQP